jgi:hypothetical protein
MQDPHRQTPGPVFVVLCVLYLLALGAPFSIPANRPAYREASAQEVVLACLEPRSPAFVLPPSVQHFSSAPHSMPVRLISSRLRPAQTLHVDLQVPEMLLQTLLKEEMLRGSTKLPELETVLTTFFAEGKVQRLAETRGNTGAH